MKKNFRMEDYRKLPNLWFLENIFKKLRSAR